MSRLLLISGSGTTEEVVRKVMGCLELGIKSISMSHNPNSPLVKCSDIHLFIPKKLKPGQYFEEEDLTIEDRHAPIDVMGNSFETGAYITSSGLVEGLIRYHKTEDIESASRRCLEYINSSVRYVKHLNKYLYSIKSEIMDMGKELALVDHIRMAASGDGAASLKMAMNRLAHSARDGIGRSIDFISSDGFGPPGSADIRKGDCVVLSSASLESPHTTAIAKEASRADAKIYLLTSDKPQKPLELWLKENKIKRPALTVYLPFSVPGSGERHFDLGVRHYLEYTVAAIFEYLGMKGEDAEKYHIQRELE
jgi:hypothetical protein